MYWTHSFLAIFDTRADMISIDYIETKKISIMNECHEKSVSSHDCNKTENKWKLSKKILTNSKSRKIKTRKKDGQQ